MRSLYLLPGVIALLGLAACSGPAAPTTQPAAAPPAQLPGPIAGTGQTLLPNGWKLSPAGPQTPLGDLPLALALAPNGRLAAVLNCGYGQNSVQLLDPATGRVLDEKTVPSAWLGLVFGAGGRTLYASGGQSNRVHCFRVENRKLLADSALVLGPAWPTRKIGVVGLALDSTRRRLYAVTREDSAVYQFDLGRPNGRPGLPAGRPLKLPAEAYAAALTPDGRRLYVTLWGGAAVAVCDLADGPGGSGGSGGRVARLIPVESHPTALLFTRDGRRLFVANANSNSVSVIDIQTQRVTETLGTALFAPAPAGSTPNALALSADESQLFVANADNNCLAVFDVREPGASRSLGFVPTGWYPTAVQVLNGNLLVANGKGSASAPNAVNGPDPTCDVEDRAPAYIGGLLRGSLSRLPLPDAAALAAFSAQVYANTPYSRARETAPEVPAGNPVRPGPGQPSPIEHVFYIIKENRTYDQVLGDMPAGNGDPNLCLFGQNITPNHHKLAHDFVLLDNFYNDAEVSADGHNWSMAAYATDYVEKTWPVYYSARGGNYDYEGGRGAVAVPEKGFLWDYCQRAGVSYRSYGEFVFKGKTGVAALQGHFDPNYSGFDMKVKDVDRERTWEADFDRLLAAGQVPRLSIIRLPNDHTAGAKRGARAPLAYAGDNDLALGRLLDHLSHSPVWAKSVVMVVEDDAQNGPDHVDAHRSTAYLAGPYVRRGAVVHTMYSTSGLLRTLELILGLPPMSQYDAAATPLWECFTAVPNLLPYTALPARTNLEAFNTAYNRPAREAEKFDLSREDAAPDLAFNRNIWQAVRGENSVMPAPRRSAFVKVGEEED